MSVSRDTRIVILVSTIGIVLTLFASYSAKQRIVNWQEEFAASTQDPAYLSSSLFLVHHRLLESMASFARDDGKVTREQLLDRVDIYWSRYRLLDSSNHVFNPSKIRQMVDDLPPDSHSAVIATSLEGIRQNLGPALQTVERELKVMQPGDYAAYMNLRRELDAFGDPLSRLQIAAYERQRYLDQVQVTLSEQLGAQLRNAFVGISAGIVLLSYVFMLYWRQKHLATERLQRINRQLRYEIRESERVGQKLSFHARHDSLSGLINRFGFSEELEGLLATNDGFHGLCFVDLDLFKIVNDTCGHAAGDELIKEVSRLLQQALPESAVVSRFGGDEFVILLRDCQQSAFMDFVDGCCEELKQYIFTYADQRFDVSGSFGAAYFDASEYDMQTLLGIVDAACYEAKNAGGSRVHFHHGEDDIIESRQHDLIWVANIQNALADDRFRLHRQPIMALGDELSARPDHWEVLVRMVGTDDELISPGQFLDVAERYSLSPRIDRWVIEKTFAWLNATYDIEGYGEYVNINLSGVSIGDSDFLSLIEKLTLTLEIPTSNVCFEITETAVMGKHANKFLVRLKELGYRLALDDFGIGLSSFGYLESLPVDYIKIDGLFVRDIDNNLTHREFVKSINDIGKVMGKQTIAEYVENQESLAILKDIGVDYVQGYHIAKPCPMTTPVAIDLDDRLTA